MQFIPDGAIRLDMALVYGVCASLKRLTDQFPMREDCAIEYTHMSLLDENGLDVKSPTIYGTNVVLYPQELKAIGADSYRYGRHKLKVSSFSGLYLGTAIGSINGYELKMTCVEPAGFRDKDICVILQPPYNKCLLNGDDDDLAVPGPYTYPLNVRDVAHRVRQALATGTVSSFIIAEGTGRIIQIPQEVWRTQLADYILDHDAPAFFVDSGQVYSGKVLVPFSDFADLFEFSEACSLSTGAYIPPYLTFALRAVAELGLSQDQRMHKKTIKHWLEKNWPRKMLGEPSSTKIEYMATFLRQPEHESAGAFRAESHPSVGGLRAISDEVEK